MTRATGRKRKPPVRGRLRDANGQFQPTPGKPPAPNRSPPRTKTGTTKQASDLRTVRAVAMDFICLLQLAMTLPEKEDAEKAPGLEKDGGGVERVQEIEKCGGDVKKKGPKKPSALPLVSLDRLIAPGKSAVDSFNVLSQIVVHMIDKERENSGPAQPDELDDEESEEDLDRRIAAELDRIAARTGAAGGDWEDSAD